MQAILLLKLNGIAVQNNVSHRQVANLYEGGILMKTWARIFLGLVGVLLIFSACGKKDSSVTIELEENPTTGYSWSYSMDVDSIVKETESKQISPTTLMMGAPGKHRWTFEAVADGQVTLTFVYARPWEIEESAEEPLLYLIEVKDGAIQILSQMGTSQSEA